MADEALTQSELDHLHVAVFEQRRLSHMVRQRGSEIEALRRELADVSAAASRARDDLRRQLAEREGELKTARYESRRAERRVAKVARDAAAAAAKAGARLEERTRQLEDRTRQLEAARAAHEQTLEAAHAAHEQALDEVEQRTRELVDAQRQIETLHTLIEERERWMKDSDRALDEIESAIERVRASRSWRFGHWVTRVLRAVTFRRARSDRSALDAALALVADARAAGSAHASAP